MERAELSHPASARTAGAAPAQGRPSTYRPLTPPPPLSGPERKADPEYVAAGGDTARYASSPRVRILEWPAFTLLPREGLAPTPTSPATAAATSQSFLSGLGARSGRERARPSRDHSARHGGGAARGGSRAAHPRAGSGVSFFCPCIASLPSRTLLLVGTGDFPAWILLAALECALVVLGPRGTERMQFQQREVWGGGSKTCVGPAGGAAQKSSFAIPRKPWGA